VTAITQNTEGQRSWKRHAVEVVVIVFSILAAFSLDSWWTDRAERGALQLELRSVQEEMVRNREHLVTWLSVHERIAQGINTLLELPATSGTMSVPDTLVMAARLVPTVDPSAGALRTIVASGRLAQVENIELRLALASWEDEVANVTEDEDGARTFVWETLNPWFRDWYAPVELQQLVTLNGLFWVDPRRTSPLPSAPIRFPVDAELQNLLLDRRSYTDVNLSELETLISLVDEILTHLSEALS